MMHHILHMTTILTTKSALSPILAILICIGTLHDWRFSCWWWEGCVWWECCRWMLCGWMVPITIHFERRWCATFTTIVDVILTGKDFQNHVVYCRIIIFKFWPGVDWSVNTIWRVGIIIDIEETLDCFRK